MLPRISFGMIILNGEPFIRYNLRSLYPYAHQIIVVEGATPGAAANASVDGHSLDTTLETLYRFQAEEDPEKKLIIITRDGFWSEKDEMSQAYAQVATGDYLWQVDSDEFYQAEDIETVIRLLQEKSSISAISFKQVTFWASPKYKTDSWYLRRGASEYHRLFKWDKDYQYLKHRPPTVLDEQGHDLRSIYWLRGDKLAKQGIYLYHYSLLFPKQVIEKSEYYASAEWSRRTGSQNWAEDVFLKLKNPFRVHNVFQYPSWLEHYQGKHPSQIEAMWESIEKGGIDIERRQTEYIEKLLNSPSYQILRFFIKIGDYPARLLLALKLGLKAILPDSIKQLIRKLRS
jgi:hypothetical protein